jgi:hypothetical protein
VEIYKMFEKKVRPITAPRCPEGSRKLRFPDYVTMNQDGGKVVRLTHRPLLPIGNTPGTHFCKRIFINEKFQ